MIKIANYLQGYINAWLNLVDSLRNSAWSTRESNSKLEDTHDSGGQQPSSLNSCLRFKKALRRILWLGPREAIHKWTSPFLVEPPLNIKSSTTRSSSTPIQPGGAIDRSLLLPTEVLQKIFLHILPDRISSVDWKLETLWPHPRLEDAFLDLRKVCQRWNDAILSSCVWRHSSIAWSVATSTKSDSTPRLAFIERQVITPPVDVISYRIGNEPMTANSDLIMDIVRRLIIDCQMARIVLPDREVVPSDNITIGPSRVQGIPRLRVLSWKSPYSIDIMLPRRWKLPWANLRQAPWEQLTAIFLHCPIAMEDCISILMRYPTLATVEFGNVNSSTVGANDDPLDSPVNSTLSSLKITSFVGIDVLFSNVQLQKITHLHLHLIYIIEHRALEDLNVPWCSLEIFVLECALDVPDAHKVFRQCRSVNRLEWHWPQGFGRDLLTILTPWEPLELYNLENLIITPTLPASHVRSLLEVLANCICSTPHLNLPSLPRFVWRGELRAGAFTRLETISLTSPISAQEFLSVVGLSIHLRKLDVRVRDANLDSDDRADGMVHPNLRHLYLRTPVKNPEPLLNSITFPSLMTFEMRYEETQYSLHWAGDYSHGHYLRGLSSLIQRSRSRVRQEHPMCSFVLVGFTMLKTDLMEIIERDTSFKGTNIVINDVLVFDSTPIADRSPLPFTLIRAQQG
ncbi:hypothetical protein BDZ94DRAFT_1063909 [Collybia nuda]|uniref:F-box domain-containing protein n=1 Tax=Collybia nuda TaxID=64659 RepID=A0A9P5XYS9_9AGAR|nr:hypothetical protein BDZ94DRAFT_1063909 [Collybia nuda]